MKLSKGLAVSVNLQVFSYAVASVATVLSVISAISTDELRTYGAATVAVIALASKPLLEFYNSYRADRRKQDASDRKLIIEDAMKLSKLVAQLESRIDIGETRLIAAEERSIAITKLIEKVVLRMPLGDDPLPCKDKGANEAGKPS